MTDLLHFLERVEDRQSTPIDPQLAVLAAWGVLSGQVSEHEHARLLAAELNASTVVAFPHLPIPTIEQLTAERFEDEIDRPSDDGELCPWCATYAHVEETIKGAPLCSLCGNERPEDFGDRDDMPACAGDSA